MVKQHFANSDKDWNLWGGWLITDISIEAMIIYIFKITVNSSAGITDMVNYFRFLDQHLIKYTGTLPSWIRIWYAIIHSTFFVQEVRFFKYFI